MIDILRSSPLLLLFAVAAIGYPLGRLRIGQSSLGIAAVLFVGLAFGALDPALQLPEIVYQLGLVLFVYTIGLSSGPGFFSALQRKGLRDNLLIFGALLLAGGSAAALHGALGLTPAQTAGLYAGALTNTPALAGVLEYIKLNTAPELHDTLLNEPIVGYSIAYPVGVLGAIGAIAILQKLWKIDYRAEAGRLRELGATRIPLVNRTIRVVRPDGGSETIRELGRDHNWHVIFVRIKHAGEITLAGEASELRDGDLISVIGHAEDVDRVTEYLGVVAGEQLELDRSKLDFRRVFVSSPQVVARRLRDLDLPHRYGALVTRVRRGDNDFLATADTVLEPGDRVRVVALRERMDEVSELFGDSYRHLSEIDILTFSLGLVIGLLIGLAPIPLPGGGVFRLGIAGGPLLVALVLSKLERTGPLVWSLPYSANLTLRQLGLVLFLAGIGTRAGYSFVTTLMSSGGALLFLAGAAITCTTAVLTLVVGYRLLKVPMSLLIGMLAALQTNPAVLSFATEQTDNDLPNIGYATVYPVAMITKIVLAQLLVAFLV
jgi:putative transport protein